MTMGFKLGALALIATGLAASGGYWVGRQQVTAHGASTSAAVPVEAAAKTERKVLFYRNPMGLPDTSPTPKKDPMGMDYVPVYDGEQDDEPTRANLIRISTDKVQKLGVRTEAVSLRSLDKTVRAAGRIEPDERLTYTIAPKFEGYVEKLHVNVTGQPVTKGQPLFEVYSPELMSAQREYTLAAQGVEALKGATSEAQRGMRELAYASLARLRNWDVPDEQIKKLAQSGEARRTVTFHSPVAGIVIEKKAVQGMRFMPGEALYQVTNLSSVWVMADVFEQDIGLIKLGAKASVRINAYPDKSFQGAITYVYPTLKPETRTVPVRIELSNPGGLLKPGMFAQIELPTSAKGAVLTVPTSAVIDSGTRQIVLVQLKEGRFESRDVKLGSRGEDSVEVIQGVQNGERVVVAANFLIDAESNLKAAVGGFGHSAHGSSPAASTSAADKPALVAVGHKGQGKVEELDLKAGTVTINHGAMESLKWPAMSTEFKVANAGLLTGLQAGAQVAFEFVERGRGEWVITAIAPAGKVAASPHTAHN